MVTKYGDNIQITTHFNSSEFKCPHCRKIIISNQLINKLEEIFMAINASKCLVSSGYRCYTYDKSQNGFAGKHSEGLAVDCIFYDKDGKIVPSKIICCIAYELGFSGVALINNNYTHLDIRTNGYYRGDERKGNSSYWNDPYKYFNLTKEQVNKYLNSSPQINYQVFTNKWLPNVNASSNEYAGIFGNGIRRVYIDKLKYRVKSNGRWLSEVIGRNDYAGYSSGYFITDIAIENATYRVHTKGRWLPWVNGYNINDYKNGYAGNGNVIDAIQIKLK